MCSLNDAVEMTTNQFQQNISIKLADDYLSTLLTINDIKFPVDLTKIFNSVRSNIRNLPKPICSFAHCTERADRLFAMQHQSTKHKKFSYATAQLHSLKN